MREFGLIGRTLVHSFSKSYFTEKFAHEGVADSAYSLFELADIDELKTLIAERPNLCGLNVTIPYKQVVMPLLDQISEQAAEIGAVNTIEFKDSKLIGHNTDYFGFRESLQELLVSGNKQPESALILGSGGASLAVQYTLAQMGIPFEIVSRDMMKGTLTYDQVTPEVINSNKLIINATPLGTYPNIEQSPTLPYAFITPEHYLYDLVYNPAETQFLSYGKQMGAKIMNGEKMLILQAEKSWQIWNK